MEEPPNKKQRTNDNKTNKVYMVVRLPKWLNDEWWNDNNGQPKHLPNSELGKIYLIPKNNNNNNNKIHSTNFDDFKVRMNINTYKKSKNSDELNIPTKFEFKKRGTRNRMNVKHGELKKFDKNQLLIFTDKPAFAIEQEIEGLDTQYINNNKNKRSRKAKYESIFNNKQFRKGKITHINNDRTYTIEFDNGHERRNVPETDIRTLNRNDPKSIKQDKCKKKAMATVEFDILPIKTKEYFKYFAQKTKAMTFKPKHNKGVTVTKKENIYDLSMEERDKIATQQKLEKKKREMLLQTKTKNNRSNNPNKKVKNVRKSEAFYKNAIFAAFENKTALNKREIEKATQEPWNFLKPIIKLLCEYHKRDEDGIKWKLKDEYRLATDAAINDDENKDEDNDIDIKNT